MLSNLKDHWLLLKRWYQWKSQLNFAPFCSQPAVFLSGWSFWRLPNSISECHCTLSSMSLLLRPYFLRSDWMVSLHLCFGLPRFLQPPMLRSATFLMYSSSSRRYTWPNHWSLFFLMLTEICFTFTSFLMSSFLTWSCQLTLWMYLSILIYVGSRLASCGCVMGQVSFSYRSVGLIAVLLRRSLSLVGIFLSHSTPIRSSHWSHATSISAPQPPSLSIVVPGC